MSVSETFDALVSLSTGTFDAIVSVSSLRLRAITQGEIQRSLAEVGRVLRPGASLALLCVV